MRKGLKLTVIVLFPAILWLVFAPLLASRLVVTKDLEKADVIFVLSGSAAYLERNRLAADVYGRGISSQILLSDDGKKAGWSQQEKRNPKFVELAERTLIKNGVPSNAIAVLDGEVTGTIYEARGFADLAEKKGWNSVLIVTSSFHTRRALWTFERELGATSFEIGIVSSPAGDLTPSTSTWWLSLDGWRYIAGEYVKSVYYWIAF